MTRAPYKPGDHISVLHHHPTYGTCATRTTISTCHPDATNGRWVITYPLAGTTTRTTVDTRGTDRHGYVIPVQ